MDKLKKAADELGSGKYWKPKEGKNIIRILPPWNDEGLFYFEAALHYGFKDGAKTKAYPCLAMYEQECPICEFAKKLAKEDKQMAGGITSRKKFYANIIDRNSNNVMIWGFSMKVLRTLLAYVQDPDWGDFTDPEEGHDIVVERTGSGKLDTKYEVRIKPKPSEICLNNWESKVIDLSTEVVEEADEDVLLQAIEDNYGKGAGSKKKNEDDDDNDDDNEEEHKKKKKSSEDDDEDEDKEDDEDNKKSKKSSKESDDDEEEEEDEPKKKKKSKEDEDDEDEDDEEEEDEPKKKKRR